MCRTWIFGQDCVVFYEDSESGLQIAPKVRKVWRAQQQSGAGPKRRPRMRQRFSGPPPDLRPRWRAALTGCQSWLELRPGAMIRAARAAADDAPEAVGHALPAKCAREERPSIEFKCVWHHILVDVPERHLDYIQRCGRSAPITTRMSRKPSAK